MDWIEPVLRRSVGRDNSGHLNRLKSTAAVTALFRRERTIPFWPPDRLEELQRRRIQAVLHHARDTVPFYRSILRDQGWRPEDFNKAADLSRLPMIDGTALAEDPMPFVSDPYRKDGREVFKTSGSTSGLRKPVFWDHPSLLLRAARGERDRVVISRLAGEPWYQVVIREFLTNEPRHTLARWLGVNTRDHQRLLILPADFSSRTQRTIYSERTVIPRRPVHYHHLPPTVPFEAAVAHMAAIRPRVVFSFGSYADQFFHYLDASGEQIPLPRLWVYLGDRISPDGRALAEERGCAVYSVYGAMEAGTIGFQCERREGFHLNIDLCPVRIVDDEGKDLPPGEPGNIVISSLDNRAMVLLNYRIGDRAVLSVDACPCGRTLPLLIRFEGRRSEIITLADGREISSASIEALFGSTFRRTVMAQLEQTAPGRLSWRIVPFAEDDRERLRDSVMKRGQEVLGSGTILDVEFVDRIPLNHSGKFQRLVTTPQHPTRLRDAT
jgi:phenylacetate-CoA ligase